MKKIVCLIAVFALLMPVVVLAKEAVNEEKSEESKMMSPEMGKFEKMCGPMMGKATMVAGQDGGVVVLIGNKLQKYDNALNLVKEVTIAMPMSGMMGDKQCPLMGGMMKGSAAEEAKETAEDEAKEKAAR